MSIELDGPSLAPDHIASPAAWTANTVGPPSGWIHVLTRAEAQEVLEAARQAAASNIDLPFIRPDDFPLPRLGARLRRLLHRDVLDGRGFAVIRGLDPQAFSGREVAAAWLGIGAHMGAVRPQNAQGHVLGHVKDVGRSSQDPAARLYQTNERQTYHTDSSDVVGLMCLRGAKSGGLSSLVSSVTIYNEMRRLAPDLARLLFEPIETDRRGEQAPGERPYFRIPVFNWHAGRFACIYQRQYIESARRFDDVAPLTAQQTAALDLFDSLAEDPALNIHIEFKPGDIQLVNNHVLLHDRTGFEDWPELERRRHLLRLWLAPPGAQPLPPVFAERFGSVTPGARGGVTVAGDARTAPLDVG